MSLTRRPSLMMMGGRITMIEPSTPIPPQAHNSVILGSRAEPSFDCPYVRAQHGHDGTRWSGTKPEPLRDHNGVVRLRRDGGHTIPTQYRGEYMYRPSRIPVAHRWPVGSSVGLLWGKTSIARTGRRAGLQTGPTLSASAQFSAPQMRRLRSPGIDCAMLGETDGTPPDVSPIVCAADVF